MSGGFALYWKWPFLNFHFFLCFFSSWDNFIFFSTANCKDTIKTADISKTRTTHLRPGHCVSPKRRCVRKWTNANSYCCYSTGVSLILYSSRMWCIRCSSLSDWTAGFQHFSTLLSENAPCSFCTQLTKYLEPKYLFASHNSYIATVCARCQLKWNSDSRMLPCLCSSGHDFPPLLWNTS